MRVLKRCQKLSRGCSDEQGRRPALTGARGLGMASNGGQWETKQSRAIRFADQYSIGGHSHGTVMMNRAASGDSGDIHGRGSVVGAWDGRASNTTSGRRRPRASQSARKAINGPLAGVGGRRDGEGGPLLHTDNYRDIFAADDGNDDEGTEENQGAPEELWRKVRSLRTRLQQSESTIEGTQTSRSVAQSGNHPAAMPRPKWSASGRILRPMSKETRKVQR